MTGVEEKREKIVAMIRTISDEQLDIVQELLQKIDLLEKNSIEFLFTEAIGQYGNTLKKLAE